jgi:TAZ zinc finger
MEGHHSHSRMKNPPSQEHSNENPIGFAPSNLAMLQRMEEVATVWLNMLLQQPPPVEQETTRIVDFCTRTLQHLLSQGGFRTPSFLHPQRLPSLQYLPCMVVTLKYWYTSLLSRCQYETAVVMLPQRLFRPGELAVSVNEYVQNCQVQVSHWLGVPQMQTSNTAACASALPQHMTPEHVALWMQQQQQLQTNRIPFFSPMKSSRTLGLIPEQQTRTTKQGSRMPSPTDVMMFDTATASQQALLEQNDKNDNTKPAAIPTKQLHSTCDLNEAVKLQAAGQRAKEGRMRGLIVSLYHASKCPNYYETNPCTVYKGCCSIKHLWRHIKQDHCTTTTCNFRRWCSAAKEALQHYGRCKSMACPICGPVLQLMPKVKQDILDAIAREKRQVEAVEEAILQVTAELAEGACSNANPPPTTKFSPSNVEVTAFSESCESSSASLNNPPATASIARNAPTGGGPFKKRPLSFNSASPSTGSADSSTQGA